MAEDDNNRQTRTSDSGMSPVSRYTTSNTSDSSRPFKSQYTQSGGAEQNTSSVTALAQRVVGNKVFVTITTLLTCYVLTGDDLKMMCTNKPADQYFDIVTYVCIFLFAVEVILSSLGKTDYFLSFFFMLDVGSTATLVLDISYINEFILDLIKGPDQSVSNSGPQTARLGSKVARVVRVVRLVRILKLYKALLEEIVKDKSKPEVLGVDEEWGDLRGDLNVNHTVEESRVGKKLSDLTTRRVIILVLFMMICLPLLEVNEGDKVARSPNYAADIVLHAFRNRTKTDYQDSLLRFLFYHNWFTANNPKICPRSKLCPGTYDSGLFWVGIKYKTTTKPQNFDNLTSRAQLPLLSVTNYNLNASVDVWKFYYAGGMPPSVLPILASKWETRCSHKRWTAYGISLLHNEIPDSVNYAVPCPTDLRVSERKSYIPMMDTKEQNNKWHFVFVFDQRKFTQEEARYSLGVTAFVCVSLCTAALFFTSDANTLVLNPVENMITKVNVIRNNPLKAMQMGDDEFIAEEVQKSKDKRKAKSKRFSFRQKMMCSTKQKKNELMETAILEKTIIKLGFLLALGFGPAGAPIIEHNMQGADSASVDAMVEGISVQCIIVVTRIRHFQIVTEVFQEHVMRFVNQIAEIVHGIVDEFNGAVCRNNGDSFLSVWRTTGLSEESVCRKADLAVVACARIIAAINRSPVLAEHRKHPGLQHRLPEKSRVCVSSALHHGWAIEGAVGSEFKIDPSYLSPNVNIAISLEEATAAYDVNIVVADSVVEKCTTELASQCRLVDQVIVPGSASPMKIFVIDLDYLTLTTQKRLSDPHELTSKERFKVRKFLEQEKKQYMDSATNVSRMFTQNPDIASMRFRFTVEFIQVFKMGYQNYSLGEWKIAQRLLCRTKTMLGGEDGPSTALLNFMESHGFIAPPRWAGYRALPVCG